MEKQILEHIKQHNKIIIHRHQYPDLDAYGAQLGLKEIIQTNFPEKLVYVVGDSNDYMYDIKMDEIPDSFYDEALAFVVDTAEYNLVSDKRFSLAKTLIVIDHHLNDTNLNPNIFYQASKWISCSEMIADIALKSNLLINQMAATYMYAGLVGDSGRFQYLRPDNANHAFYIASELSKQDIDFQKIYEFLYSEPLEVRNSKKTFMNFELTKNLVAYRLNTIGAVNDSNLGFSGVSRGTINLMAGIKEVPIWANFTQNDKGQIVAELRSRKISIVDIAKKYGGGGHANACGATLSSWQEVQLLLNDLNERALSK